MNYHSNTLFFALFTFFPVFAMEKSTEEPPVIVGSVDSYSANKELLRTNRAQLLEIEGQCPTNLEDRHIDDEGDMVVSFPSSTKYREMVYKALKDCGHPHPELVVVTNNPNEVFACSGPSYLGNKVGRGINLDESKCDYISYGALRIIIYHEIMHLLKKHYYNSNKLDPYYYYKSHNDEREADQGALIKAHCVYCINDWTNYFLFLNRHEKFKYFSLEKLSTLSNQEIDRLIEEAKVESEARANHFFQEEHPLHIERALRAFKYAKQLDMAHCPAHVEAYKKDKEERERVLKEKAAEEFMKKAMDDYYRKHGYPDKSPRLIDDPSLTLPDGLSDADQDASTSCCGSCVAFLCKRKSSKKEVTAIDYGSMARSPLRSKIASPLLPSTPRRIIDSTQDTAVPNTCCGSCIAFLAQRHPAKKEITRTDYGATISTPPWRRITSPILPSTPRRATPGRTIIGTPTISSPSLQHATTNNGCCTCTCFCCDSQFFEELNDARQAPKHQVMPV